MSQWCNMDGNSLISRLQIPGISSKYVHCASVEAVGWLHQCTHSDALLLKGNAQAV